MLARNLLLRQDRDKITQLLGPAERLLALTVFEVPDGKWGLEDPPDPPDHRSGPRKAGDAAVGAAAFLVTGPDPPSLGKMLGGCRPPGMSGRGLTGSPRRSAVRAGYLTSPLLTSVCYWSR